jgi:hypothetical protein
MTEDLGSSSFLETTENYFMPKSTTISFAVEEDPWSAAGFDPVAVMRQPLAQTGPMDDELVTEGISASNVLGKHKISGKFIKIVTFLNLFTYFSRSRFTRDI